MGHWNNGSMDDFAGFMLKIIYGTVLVVGAIVGGITYLVMKS